MHMHEPSWCCTVYATLHGSHCSNECCLCWGRWHAQLTISLGQTDWQVTLLMWGRSWICESVFLCFSSMTYHCWHFLCLWQHFQQCNDDHVVVTWMMTRGVRNPMKMSDIGFLKTELNQPQNSKTKNSGFHGSVFKSRLRRFGDRFSRCLIHNSSSNIIGSTVKVFFFMPYLCTSSSESLWLTVSWTNLARKYVISIIIP